MYELSISRWCTHVFSKMVCNQHTRCSTYWFNNIEPWYKNNSMSWKEREVKDKSVRQRKNSQFEEKKDDEG